MGLGVNLRETIGFYAPWLVLAPFLLGWKFQRREVLCVVASCVVFVVLALGWFGYWFITDPHYRWVWHGWRESMREESCATSGAARQPASVRDALLHQRAARVFDAYLFAPVLEWRKRRLSPMLLLWAVAFFANLLLFFNYSTTVNWRYFLTGLPGIVPLGAFWLLRIAEKRVGSERRGVVCVLVCHRVAGCNLFHFHAAGEFRVHRAARDE